VLGKRAHEESVTRSNPA